MFLFHLFICLSLTWHLRVCCRRVRQGCWQEHHQEAQGWRKTGETFQSRARVKSEALAQRLMLNSRANVSPVINFKAWRRWIVVTFDPFLFPLLAVYEACKKDLSELASALSFTFTQVEQLHCSSSELKIFSDFAKNKLNESCSRESFIADDPSTWLKHVDEFGWD